MDQSLVSVILTSYNKPEWVGKAIESVLKQTYPYWELWVMDDHSSQNVQDIINKYTDDKRIHVVNSLVKDEERPLTTRYATLINQAILLANGAYITYLTDDTMYMPDRLAKMVDFLERQKVHVIYSSQLVRQVDQKKAIFSESILEAKDVLEDAAFIVDHCSVMHTRDVLIAVKEKYGSCWDDDPACWNHGDAAFWKRLNAFAPFYPLLEILDVTYKTPMSFQNLYRNLSSPLIDGSIVSGSSGERFIIDRSRRRLLAPKWFTFYKYNRSDIIQVPDPVLFQYSEAEPIDGELHLPNYRLLFCEENQTLYYLDGGRKRKLLDSAAFNRYKFSRKEIVTLASQALAPLGNGPDITSFNGAVPGPLPNRRVFLAGFKYWISLNDKICEIEREVLERYHLKKDIIPLSLHAVQGMPKGERVQGVTKQ